MTNRCLKLPCYMIYSYSFATKCFTDFSNLDGFATGTRGGGSGQPDPENLPQITVNTNNKQILRGKISIVHACLPRMTQISSWWGSTLFHRHCFTEPFDDAGAIAWKSVNSILSKTLDIVEAALQFAGFISETCVVYTSAISGTAAPCKIPATTVQIVIFITITIWKP